MIRNTRHSGNHRIALVSNAFSLVYIKIDYRRRDKITIRVVECFLDRLSTWEEISWCMLEPVLMVGLLSP